MRELPPDLPEKGRYAALNRWLNQIKACLYSIRPLQSENTLTGSTPHGTFRSSSASGKGDGAGNPEILQWDPRDDYGQNDLAFCDTDPELDDGTQAGLYQAINDIPGDVSNPEPADDPTNWRMVARGHWSRITMRSGNTRIRLDIAQPSVTLYNDTTDGTGGVTSGAVKIDLTDIPGGAGDKLIKLREWQVCLDFGAGPTPMTAVFLSSDYY